MTEAQIKAIGLAISTLSMLAGLFFLGKRFIKFIDKPSMKSFFRLFLDILFTWIGFLIGAVLLGNPFVGILIGIWMSWIISTKLSNLIDLIADKTTSLFKRVVRILSFR